MSTTSQLRDVPAVAGGRGSIAGLPEWVGILLNQMVSGAMWVLQRARAQRARKNLRVCESVSLGEKRFVAVVQVDGERFLIAGAAGSVAMLTRLESKTFAAELERCAKGGEAS